MSDGAPTIKVRNAFSSDLTFVDENAFLSECLPLLKTSISRTLVVQDASGKYVGVLDQKSMRRSKLDPSSVKVKALMRSPPLVQLNDSISETARLMIESQIMQLPVFAGKKLKGLITSEQVIDSAVGGNQGQTRVVQLMTKKPLVVSKDETVGEVLNLFREHGISHSPVTHDGGLQGIVSIQDIIDIAYRSRNRQTSGERVGEKVDITDINVGGIMRFPVVTVDPEETLRNCTKKMSENDVSCLVVARNDRVLGIVTKKDFLELVAQTIPQTRPFTVQFSVKPDVRVRLDSQEVMIDAFESFAGKYEDALGSGILFVYIKSLGSGSKAHQLVQCRFQLRTTKGLFHSSSEAWGTIDAFLLALERLERRVIQSKEMELDSEYVRRHIEDYLSSEK